MKRRLYHPSLTKMAFALASEQAISQQRLCTLQRSAFHKLVCAGRKNISDEFGMIHEKAPSRPHPKRRHVAKPRQSRQETGRIFSEGSKMPADEIGFYSWR
jgi:hypothetical protein